MSKLITIERHIMEQQRRVQGASGVFSELLYDIALSAKIIARETTRAGLVNILGATDQKNASGEIQRNLDVFADQTIFRMCDHTGRLCVMASEENEDILEIPKEFPCGKYVLLYDPLDGSGNIDTNGSVGTIFAIYRKITDGERGTLQDVLQPGRKLVAAGYIVYGPSTMMVYSTGSGVHGFTLDPSVGEFLLSHENIRIPQASAYYSINHGNQRHWTPAVRHYIDYLQGANDQPAISMRYAGALVADFHRNLLEGGVYCYPGDLRDPAKPNGKLRLTYECIPLAFIAEQAGGYGSDGIGNLLDIQPASLHQRVPLFIGNRELVQKAEQYIRDYDQDWLAAYTPRRQPAEV